MAKDPAFLFYPGDASDDTQFMNRLERGCYFDILKAQKKFVKFSLDQLKKVLGKDFETCWHALELVLKFEEGFYFIEWVNDAVEKRKKHCDHQANNGKKGGRPPKINPNETQTKPNDNPRVSNGFQNKKPLENVNENIIVDNDDKEGLGEKEEKDPEKFYPDTSFHGVDLTTTEFELTIAYLENVCSKEFKSEALKNQWLAPPEIERQWKGFKIQYFTGNEDYDEWTDVIQHFRDWLKKAIQKDKTDYGTHRRTNKESAASFIP